jgi:hypothetical protein
MERVHKFVSVNNSERFGARKGIFTNNICTKSDQEYTVLELSHPFPDNTDSMILKSIKQFVIKIRVPAATLQNADRSTYNLRASRDFPECRSVDHVICVNPESKPTIFC